MGLSVIILSYNVEKLLKVAIQSVYDTCSNLDLQIIVVDNASTDNSVAMIKKTYPKVKLVESKVNTGFAAGNNLARPFVKSDTVLFLNPDTIVKGNAIEHCLDVLNKEKPLGAITCKVMLPNGELDYSCHRGLPTVWNTFGYFSGLDKTGYTASNLDINTVHDVDCITGAFMMIKKKVLDKIGWWDEDYWWNGDDIEICYKIKKAGFKIRFDPTEQIVHYKGSSSGLWKTGAGNPSRETRVKAAKSATRAMGIFVNKHQYELGPKPLIMIVKSGIWLLEKYRLWKIDH